MTLRKMDCHALSDAGSFREENDDQFLIADLVKAIRVQTTSLSHDSQTEVSGQSHGKIFMVADGIGGSEAGRRASLLAVDEMINCMVNRMEWFALRKRYEDGSDQKSLADDLVDAMTQCQQRIRDEAAWHSSREGMGTTLTVAIIDWPRLHVVHVGGNRCYVCRGDRLEQLTRDHTLARALQEKQVLAAEELEDSIVGDAVWNVVGGRSDDLRPEVCHAQLSIGDALLLCTDGLTSQVDDSEIAAVLQRKVDAKHTCEQLIAEANRRGGADNVTVALARFHDADDVSLKDHALENAETLLTDHQQSEKSEKTPNADVPTPKVGL
jgi:serine/threonine protein phosphatase PrpC